MSVEVILELGVGNLISRLISAIFRIVLLYGVVCEMNFGLKYLYVELIGGGAHIAFFEPVGSCDSVEIGDEHVVPDIEFTIVVEERPIDVLLHDESAMLGFCFGFVGCFIFVFG